MFRCLCVSILAVAPLAAADKPNRDIQELQRDVAQLQELVKNLQRSLEEKLGTIQTQTQKSADSAAQAGAAVAAVQRSLDQGLKDQDARLVPQVTGMNARMDSVSSDLRTLQTAVSDLAGTMSKLQTQVADVGNAVKIINAPPAAPPPAGAVATAASAGRPETPPISASDLFANADRDRIGGKLDLAQQEFSDYLRWYGETPQAHMAQYLIASIYYSQNNYEAAVKEFETLMQNYPASSKIPDALYYKGQSLVELGRATEATETIRELKRRYPGSDFSKKPLSPRRG